MSDIPHILRIHGRKITLGIDDTDPTPDGLLEKAADRIEALEAALKDCADDLEDELIGRYGVPPHPAMQGLFERDMLSVTAARALISQTGEIK